MREWLKRLRFSTKSVPIAIFVLCGLAFGPLINQLGFYWDDWPVIQTAYLKADFWEYYSYNRPASAWSHAFTAPFLGVSPLNWHLFFEVTWGLIGGAFWWMLQQLWPRQKMTNLMMALLFVVHPIYLIHPIAVTFIQHNLTYIPFFISFGAMLAAMRQPHRFWVWMVVGVVANLIHAFSMEYFWGLELLRPVFVCLVLWETNRNWRQWGWPGMKIWLPYLAATGGGVVWRVFFARLAESDPNELVLLSKLAQNPVNGVVELTQMVLRDGVYAMIIRWFDALQVSWFNLTDRFGLFVWGLGVVTGMVFWLYFVRLEKSDGDGNTSGNTFMLVGVFAFVAGGMSAWLAGRQLTVGLYADRLALPMLVGVVMVTVGVVEVMMHPKMKALMFAILLGLAVTLQLRTQNDYRWDWVNQQRAFWQLSWRAPALAANTTVFSDGSLFRFTGGYPTASAMNVLYPQRDTDKVMDYWFLELDRGYIQLIPDMIAGPYPIKADFRQYAFASTSQQSIVVYYASEAGNCLWVMRETDRFNPDLPALTKEAVPLSNLSRILPEGTAPDEVIFGREPAHMWCYFYQKAELARQQEDWAGIVKLAEESTAQGFSPNNRLEWLPFVEAFAHTGAWEQAIELSVEALNYSRSTRNLFCPVWRGFEREGLEAPAGTFAEVYGVLGCEAEVDE